MNPQELQDTVMKLKRDLEGLQAAYYQGNFLSSQDFSKYCRFNNRLKVPHYESAPSVGEVGEIIEVAGNLYICTATTPTWTLVGSQ